MSRQTGQFRVNRTFDEEVRAFVPFPLPPRDPPLDVHAYAAELSAAEAALGRLRVAGAMVPNTEWFLYGFVRKEAVLSSQIEGTQATLRDVVEFEATSTTARPLDVEEVCNYVEALGHARSQLRDPAGLPLSTRLLCDAHRILMSGTRGEERLPGEIRRSQNWIGGSRPGNAVYVPPPPDDVPPAMGELERWIHSDDPLPPVVRAGLAHAQFESIHPFLDGNGRIGRMLVTLLAEHWHLLDGPYLYLSLPLKHRRQEYYARLAKIRSDGDVGGDWEGWTRFFLECVRDAADDGVRVAGELHALIGRDRERLLGDGRSTVAAIRLLEELPSHPVVTVRGASNLLGLTAPATRKAIELLEELDVLRETTGRKRDRVYAYQAYLDVLTEDD